MSEASESFADTLRDAIAGSGLGLDRIRDHLGRRGVELSVATLSYWQSGRSLPERRSSLAALPHLEQVLGLDPGGLRGTLPPAQCRERRNPVRDLDAVWPDPPQLDVLDRLDTGWDDQLDRVSVHDVLVIGAERRQRSMTVRQVLRARCDGPDRRVVLHNHDDPDAPLPEIRAVTGCEVSRIDGCAEDGVVGAELGFLQPLRRGETVVVEYELRAGEPGPCELEYQRRLRQPVRQYLLEVEFHPRALPASCTGFRDEEETPLELDPAHRVHLLDIDSTAASSGIRWSWAEPSG